MRFDVYLEIGAKRTFAGALDWPGWARSGRSAEDALEALARYGARYAAALEGTVEFAAPADASHFDVVEQLTGGPTTDFGAPGAVPGQDLLALDEAELERQTALLRLAWRALDAIAAEAAGLPLRKGPRGGGRELEQIGWHVLGAEQAYLSKLGARHRLDESGDLQAETARLRTRVLEVLPARVRGEEIDNPSATRSLWTPRYFVRRAAWHVLDHAWEIEDRAEPAA